MKLTDLFFIEYPKTLIFADMIPQKDGINFISSQDKNNGVVAKVQECEGIKKYPAGIITVPLKGSVLMASFAAGAMLCGASNSSIDTQEAHDQTSKIILLFMYTKKCL